MPVTEQRFYVAAGALPTDATFYVERQADKDLYSALLSDEYCYVLNSRLMGKSSLSIRTMNPLNDAGVRTVFLDLTRFVGATVSPEQVRRLRYNRIMVEPNINIPKLEISTFCRRNCIAKLSLFGSALRKDFHDGSDVDFLVEFELDAKPTYFKLMEIEEELSRLIGRTVDLRTPMELSKYIRQRVMDEAEAQYVCG